MIVIGKLPIMHEPPIPDPAMTVVGAPPGALSDGGTPVSQTITDKRVATGGNRSRPNGTARPSSSPAPRPPEAPQTRKGLNRVREVIERLNSRRPWWVELFLSPYSASGWGVSLFAHAILLVALAFLILAPERTEKPVVLSGENIFELVGGVGDEVGDDLGSSLGSTIEIESTPTLSVSSGIGGGSGLNVGNIFGASSGAGGSLGSGVGDGIGADILGRVRAAGGKGGRLQISMAWNDRNDLDLELILPDEDRIYYGNKRHQFGGELDVDMNVDGESLEPVENITWKEAVPKDGKYQILVRFFQKHGPPRSPFTVRMEIGKEVRMLTGTASKVGQEIAVATLIIRDGRCISIDANLKNSTPPERTVVTADTRRAAAREQNARTALTEALGTSNERLRLTKLERVIERFSGTEAADEAKTRLEQFMN